MKLQCFGSYRSFRPFILSFHNMPLLKNHAINSSPGLSLTFRVHQLSSAHQSEASPRQENLLKAHSAMKAVAESISFNISGRSLTYLLCCSHFWARGSSFLFLLHSTHQTSTFLPTAKVLVHLVYITAMPKRNQLRQGSQHTRSCTNPTGNYHLKPKKQTTKPEDARCEGSAGLERCSLWFQIPQQHGRKENTSSELSLQTMLPPHSRTKQSTT